MVIRLISERKSKGEITSLINNWIGWLFYPLGASLTISVSDDDNNYVVFEVVQIPASLLIYQWLAHIYIYIYIYIYMKEKDACIIWVLVT